VAGSKARRTVNGGDDHATFPVDVRTLGTIVGLSEEMEIVRIIVTVPVLIVCAGAANLLISQFYVGQIPGTIAL